MTIGSCKSIFSDILKQAFHCFSCITFTCIIQADIQPHIVWKSRKEISVNHKANDISFFYPLDKQAGVIIFTSKETIKLPLMSYGYWNMLIHMLLIVFAFETILPKFV